MWYEAGSRPPLESAKDYSEHYREFCAKQCPEFQGLYTVMKKIHSIDGVRILRYLLAIEFLGILFSPPFTNLVELLILILVLVSSDIRTALKGMFSLWWFKGLLAFLLVILVWVFIGEENANLVQGIDDAFGWRKILLMPLAFVAFLGCNRCVEDFIFGIQVVLLFSACLSFILWSMGAGYKGVSGVLIRNSATQGIYFVISAFIWAVLYRYRAVFLNEKRSCGLLGKARFMMVHSAPPWVIILLANAMLVCDARTAYGLMLVLTIFFAYHVIDASVSKRLFISVVSAVVIVTVVLSIPNSRIALERIWDSVLHPEGGEISTTARMEYLKTGVSLLPNVLPLGAGTGAYVDAYKSYIEKQGSAESNQLTHDPHNQYLRILTEQGVVGIVVFLSFLLIVYHSFSGQWQKILGKGILLAWMVSSLFNSHFYTFSEGRMIFLLLGIILASGMATSGQSAEIPNPK